ncbi:hypothetical protein HME9302_02139 [Alteripontixanthobacter maritimus]|uniref:DUF2975 domain-containing protein n=1 Tax=Alteripontixanthobacter maritimus TaxID=2161824 RepID=A0A369Q8W8_9SPHN|nr:DUF2975 domain-containing protein [Alteripontixanthobacter maritimus]RDC60922.1 hypothetical protein HME9302_02139 [Alteripontixanthobacter maritimus]
MRPTHTDPLLLIGRIAVLIAQGLMAIAAFGVAIAIPALYFFRDTIVAEMAAEHPDTDIVFPTLPIVGALLLAFVAVAGLFVFFGKLRHIIGTVEQGDPFVSDNASRLTVMAWIMLGVQLLAIPLAGLGLYVAKLMGEAAAELDDLTVDVGLDVSGILLVVVLFILARVFRQGTSMRDDLEGTV